MQRISTVPLGKSMPLLLPPQVILTLFILGDSFLQRERLVPKEHVALAS
jgi:hypothetical protein